MSRNRSTGPDLPHPAARLDPDHDPDGRSREDDSFDPLLRQIAEAWEPEVPGRRAILPVGASLAGGRLSVVRRIGAGGMGVVYEAFDEKRRAAVALKTLTRLDATGIYRLKGEFRSLASVVHPNLVRLHDLFADDEQWFFTMDLVAGRPFLEHVRSGSTATPSGTLPSPADGDGAPAVEGGSVADRVLRDALRQLAAGVQAIHAEGKLHRDLKPQNVLVRHDGQVVILDFGLVSSQTDRPIGETAEDVISGTPAYMAPEQAAGEGAVPASDWYAVGVMLYEALTGELPFLGTHRQVLLEKRTADPVSPGVRCPGVPADLDALCMALLHRDPDRRATGTDIVRAVGRELPSTASTPAEGTVFVGRSEELRRLETAWTQVRAGTPAVALVSGPSGVGKTSVVQRFLADKVRGSRTLVLRGRCHEREFVPFKAFDGVIDDLGRYLRTLPREKAAELLPRDIHALARVFPTLRRVDAIANATTRDAAQLDDRVLRRRAFVALKDLLCKLCDRENLAVFVDDLQWGDGDSAVLLEELVGQPDPPALLFVGCYRDDGEKAELVQRVLALGKGSVGPLVTPLTSLPIGPLDSDEAAQLAQQMLDNLRGGGGADASARSAEIARESNGLPYFVAELVRFSLSQEGGASDAGGRMASLPEVVAARAAALPAPARRLLDVVALAGRVIAFGLAAQVAQLAQVGDPHEALDTLLAAKLIRRTGPDRDDVIAYHDRVRETISETVEPDRARAIYEQLALAIEATGRPEAEWLCELYQRAGMGPRAGAHAVVAGDQAAEGLAFRRAATHYRFALEHAELDPQTRSRLQRKLGDALANAGLSDEAAGAYAAAIQGAPAHETLELERLAGEQFVRAGRIDEGLDAFRNVLRDAGVSLPRSTGGVLAALLAARALLRVRGLGYKLRDEREVPPALMRRVHALRAAYPIGGRDPVLGALVMAKYASAALDSGVGDHVMHVIVGEGVYASVFGGPAGEKKVDSLRPEVLRLEQAVATPAAASRTKYFETMTAFCLGRWKAAVRAQAEGEALPPNPGGAWELQDLAAKSCAALVQIGDVQQLRTRLPALIHDARDRSDDQALEQLLGAAATMELASDRPDTARDLLQELDALWTTKTFSATHVAACIAEAQRLLYLGDPDASHAFLVTQWDRYRRSGLSRVHVARVLLTASFAACALAHSAHRRIPVPGHARDLVRSLDRETVAWVRGPALLAQAGLDLHDGREARSVELLERAATAFDAADMRLDATCCRHRSGMLLGGSDGASRVREAEQSLAAVGIRNPRAWAAMSTAGVRAPDPR